MTGKHFSFQVSTYLMSPARADASDDEPYLLRKAHPASPPLISLSSFAFSPSLEHHALSLGPSFLMVNNSPPTSERRRKPQPASSAGHEERGTQSDTLAHQQRQAPGKRGEVAMISGQF